MRFVFLVILKEKITNFFQVKRFEQKFVQPNPVGSGLKISEGSGPGSKIPEGSGYLEVVFVPAFLLHITELAFSLQVFFVLFYSFNLCLIINS
jgi:hypothetical protein